MMKRVNVATKSGGSSGSQVLIGQIKKIDAQGPTAYLNNVRLSVMINEAEQDVACITGYLTTDNAWSDDYVLTAATTAGGPGGTLNLVAKRPIHTNADTTTQSVGQGGPIYVWIEIGDYVAAEQVRYIAETWGRFIKYEEQ